MHNLDEAGHGGQDLKSETAPQTGVTHRKRDTSRNPIRQNVNERIIL